MTPRALALALLASTALCAAYALGGVAWPLGFVALVPWLRALDASATWRRTALVAWAMAVGYTLATLGWFGDAIGRYSGLGEAAGVALLAVAAPLLQPQFIAFALVRRLAARQHARTLAALAAASAWVAAEWALPRLLGDSLGHGLYPSRTLRQAADLGGAAGLALALLLANEAVAAGLARRAAGWRAMRAPLAAAAAVPLLLAAYGVATLDAAPAATATPLRVGIVQADIVDYERLRQEKGAGAVVREVLDTHFAMSWDAVERQHADAVLWPETVYPTTFGHPKSEAGAALDREILDMVDAARVPFVFGTYDADAAGEYNAAAFVQPGRGLLGLYRKTRLFPFTERVPAWLDGPALRRALPWAGRWQSGDGARVFPLRLADGREIPVLPLICRDDVDPALAIDGARLGAQAILTLSNDAWFAGHPHGAALHEAVAAFRSIETRLPQFRATTNGFSAAIDATGEVVAGTRMGERTLVIGDLRVGTPPRTLMVAWGDWVGRAGAVFLALLAAWAALRRWGVAAGADVATGPATLAWPLAVVALPPAARAIAGALRTLARAGLVWMIATIATGDAAVQANTLALIRSFVALFLVPEAAAWCVLRAFAARAEIVDGVLRLTRGTRRVELPLAEIAAVEPWRLPVPAAGLSVRLVDGTRWTQGLALGQADALARALAPAPLHAPDAATRYAQARLAPRAGLLGQPLVKFGLLPLLLAIPAFRLHQHIAYGSAFGEYLSFGLRAYAATFALWWAAWTIAVVLCAAAVRGAIEAGTFAGAWLAPTQALPARRWLERAGLAVLYLGMPAWLVLRIVAA